MIIWLVGRTFYTKGQIVFDLLILINKQIKSTQTLTLNKNDNNS